MPVEIIIPSPGESITEVTVGSWLKADGEWVEQDEPLVEIESDKVTLEIPAPASGVLHIGAEKDAEMNVGDVVGTIDADAPRPAPAGEEGAAVKPSPAAQIEVATETSSAAAGSDAAPGGAVSRATPLAKKIAAEKGVSLGDVHGTGPSGRITKSDVIAAVPEPAAASSRESQREPAGLATRPAQVVSSMPQAERGIRRQKMSRLRLRVAERLVAAQRTAAMLTTFNEADMTAVMHLRRQHKETFLEKHGVGLGFMSFFVKACVSALGQFPGVNAYVVGEEIEYHDYCDLAIAVGTPRGLVVPVLRDAERMSFADIESAIKDLATRAQDGKLAIEEMTGGTFTISNGGVYGSLMSTPILNPPQSGILGMHKIMNRPIEDPANPGRIAIRPMMYLALSYDHRIVDGEQAVKFLIHIKQCIEDPQRLLLDI